MTTEVFLSAATGVSALLRSPELDARWAQPSALPAFTVGGLAGHLSRAVFTTGSYLGAEVPAGVTPVDADAYLGMLATVTDEDNRQVVERSAVDAGAGPDDLRARYDATLTQLREALPALPGDRPIAVFRGLVMPMSEYLKTRLVELLVHADDLAVSLGVPTPELGDEASDLVIGLLARLARRRHGTAALLRALARSERAGPITSF